MSRLLFIAVLLMFLSINALAQNKIVLDTTTVFWKYYQNIILAEKEHLNSNYIRSDYYYSIAFNNVNNKGFHVDFFSAAKNISGVNTEKMTYYLELSIENGLQYNKLKRDELIGKTLSKIELRRLKLKFKSIDIKCSHKLKKQVNKMVFRDQHLARAFWTDWLSWDKQCKIMDKYDIPNAQKLLRICRESGWPGFDKIGENTNIKTQVDGVSLLVQHFSKEYIDSLFPYMLQAVENGQLYPEQLARTIDYHYMISSRDSADYTIYERKTIYGTFTDGGGKSLAPFGTLEEVNQFRKVAGLEPIEQFCRKTKCTIPTYTKDYMRKKKPI